MKLGDRVRRLEDRQETHSNVCRVHGNHPPGADPRVVCRTCKSMTEEQYQRFRAGKDGPHIIIDI